MIWLGSCLAFTSSAGAEPSRLADAAQALLAVQDADPLELARVAHRVGDDVVLALLAPSQPTGVRLAAVRTAPWLAEPERALMALSALLSSRDSDLAPAGAHALLQIARSLDDAELKRRELLPAELASVVAELHRVTQLRWVRADIVLAAAAAAAQLEAAGVPAPAPASK
jgi:hypothetical protein